MPISPKVTLDPFRPVLKEFGDLAVFELMYGLLCFLPWPMLVVDCFKLFGANDAVFGFKL